MHLKKYALIIINLTVLAMGATSHMAIARDHGGLGKNRGDESTKPKEDNGPGLQQTTDWIKSKLDYTSHGESREANNDIIQSQDSVYSIQFDGCNVAYSYEINAIQKSVNSQEQEISDKTSRVHKMKFTLVDAKKAGVLENISPFIHIVDIPLYPETLKYPTRISISGAKNNFEVTNISIDRKGNKEEKNETTYYENDIHVKDYDSAERVVKAFNHAIDICNKKPRMTGNELF